MKKSQDVRARLYSAADFCVVTWPSLEAQTASDSTVSPSFIIILDLNGLYVMNFPKLCQGDLIMVLGLLGMQAIRWPSKTRCSRLECLDEVPIQGATEGLRK